MDLKLSEGNIRTTQYRFMSKNSKNLDSDFERKIQKIPKGIVWLKKLAETATASAVEMLA